MPVVKVRFYVEGNPRLRPPLILQYTQYRAFNGDKAHHVAPEFLLMQSMVVDLLGCKLGAELA